MREISDESRERARELAAVGTFALGGVGFAGTTSQGEELTRELSRRPDAIEAFTWLGQLAAPAPRLYTYWALRTLAPERASALAAKLRDDRTEVERMSGCAVFSSTVAQALADQDLWSGPRAMPRP